MTCLCKKYLPLSEQQACLCDTFVHPEPLQIAAGLRRLPRQMAFFPEFRRAMLADVRTQAALADWRAREKDDLGLMLLEMWAYVCDNISFYDEVIAHEAYVRTAMRRPSIRRLVDLLGYLPKPAVAASVELAAIADGRQEVTLPVGTAFRSGGFDDEGPQVFELTKTARIHPLTNKWDLQAPHPGIVLRSNPSYLLIEPEAEITTGTRLLIIDQNNAAQNQVATVRTVQAIIGKDEQNYTQVIFTQNLKLAHNTSLEGLQLYVATQEARIISSNAGQNLLSLDKQYPLQTGQYVIISQRQNNRWFELDGVSEDRRVASSNNSIRINNSVFNLPDITIPVTRIQLDTSLNNVSRRVGGIWSTSSYTNLTVHYNMVNAGRVVDEAKTTLIASDPLQLSGIIEAPVDGYKPSTYLFEDKNKASLLLNAELDYEQQELGLGQGEAERWTTPLTLPVTAFGNVIQAVRGETVNRETLGSGDASQASQAFKLKKKPLTYIHAPTVDNDQGVESTLKIYVDGILWKEVPSFFGKTEEDQVYIVRQDDEGDSIITFGDGERGQRVPTGVDNIIASYRFGAGAAAPPAGSITQLAKPAKGLRSVKNTLSAYGGGDAEDLDNMRAFAPKSILTLGRAVSMQDMEAVTMAVSGVRMVQSEWRWDGRMQQPVAKIWYIGDAQLKTTISQRLHAVTDPSTPIQVVPATAIPAHLNLNVKIDPRYLEEKVVTALFDVLLGEKTGLLRPEQLKIGQPLFRSVLFAAVMSVEGSIAVEDISWHNTLFCDAAQDPGAGNYFDFEQGSLIINGNSSVQ
ncbi:MAG: hypothetical protein AAGG75_03160 [Bacteroidota bacterium]